MKVFLAGIGCVGKTAVGKCLAGRLGYPFFDLDIEIEKYFFKPIERLRAKGLTPLSFRKQCVGSARRRQNARLSGKSNAAVRTILRGRWTLPSPVLDDDQEVRKRALNLLRKKARLPAL